MWHRYRAFMGSSLSSTNSNSVRFFEYILTTAKNWKGEAIGEFIVEITPCAPLRSSDIFGITIPGFREKGGKLSLALKSFVPSRELFVSVYGEYYLEPISGPLVWRNPSYVKRETQRWLVSASSRRLLTEHDLEGRTAKELTLIRNKICARHGRPFKDPEMKGYFSSRNWYVPEESYSEPLLTEVEKKNAAFARMSPP